LLGMSIALRRRTISRLARLTQRRGGAKNTKTEDRILEHQFTLISTNAELNDYCLLAAIGVFFLFLAAVPDILADYFPQYYKYEDADCRAA